jgi:predicted anti-sigma-YlaC factor YlaD
VKPVVFCLVAMLAASGCSLRRMAVNQVGNALAAGGGVFAADDDPELVQQAVPFGLKLQESLLAESPRHRPLLLACARGFTQYAYAFVQLPADELEATSLAAAQAARDRARRLYLRARQYGLRGLELSRPGFQEQLRRDPTAAVQAFKKRDVPLLYWTAAAWGATIAMSKDRPDLVAELPQMVALMERARQLDEAYERGAIPVFLISLEMNRPGTRPAEAVAAARKHFERALQLSGGRWAGPYVTWAEAVCVAQQNATEFREVLNKALAVDVEAAPEWRLANVLAQRRARWLLARVDELFAE